MNFIELYSNALDASVCEQTCKLMDDIICRDDPGTGMRLSDDSSRKDYNIFTRIYGSLQESEERIIRAVENSWLEYNKKYNATPLPFSDVFDKRWKLQKSQTDGGFYTWHFEQGSSEASKSRFAVWMIYLNTVENGGKTEFEWQEVAFKPEQGTAVIWPAGYTHSHRAAPDLQGDKYIATGWFTYP